MADHGHEHFPNRTSPHALPQPSKRDCSIPADFYQISLAYLNPADNLSPWTLHRLFQSGTRARKQNDPFMNPENLRHSGYQTFIASVTIHVNNLFHVKCKSPQLIRLLFQDHVAHLGKSSFTFKRLLLDKETGESMAWALVTWVLIDKSSRRPTSLPDWFVNSFSAKVPPTLPHLRFPIPPKPKLPFTHSVTVSPSDTDYNKHANQAAFVRFAFDAAWLACRQSFFPNFSGDLHEYCIKDQHCVYKREARVGEVLKVHVWSPDGFSGPSGCIIGTIQNESEQERFYIKFSFYAQLVQSKY